MKYLYIFYTLLLILCTYKPLSAAEQYAFFIPRNAEQRNDSLVDLNQMRPRVPEKTSQQFPEQEYNTKSLPNHQDEYKYQEHTESKTEETTKPSYKSVNTHQNTKKTVSRKRKIKLPYQPKNIVQITDATQENTPQPETNSTNEQTEDIIPAQEPSKTPQLAQQQKVKKTTDPSIQQKLKKYKLDKNPISYKEQAQELAQKHEKPQLTELQKLKQMTTEELLDRIPFPDKDLPDFKQAYSIYGVELRILKNRGHLPENLRQEDILAKAKSLKRFEVK